MQFKGSDLYKTANCFVLAALELQVDPSVVDKALLSCVEKLTKG